MKFRDEGGKLRLRLFSGSLNWLLLGLLWVCFGLLRLLGFCEQLLNLFLEPLVGLRNHRVPSFLCIFYQLLLLFQLLLLLLLKELFLLRSI